jgi:hypothetical protein
MAAVAAGRKCQWAANPSTPGVFPGLTMPPCSTIKADLEGPAGDPKAAGEWVYGD